MDRFSTGAEFAEAALETYIRLNGPSGPQQCEIVDLITDLLHLAKSRGLAPAATLQKAEQHFHAETQCLPALIVAARALKNRHH
ncbi:MAG TPA: hypothetical protein VGD16_12955 [Enterovirga sp.]